MMIVDLINKINALTGKESASQSDIDSTPPTLLIQPAELLPICQYLYEDKECYFDLLESISGIDNGPDANQMEVIYHLYSISYDQQLGIRVLINREKPEVDSITGIWRTANWLEREVFDLYGIVFKNHPDLRRILLPADWEGFPLRKDYKTQNYYHGVKVDFDGK